MVMIDGCSIGECAPIAQNRRRGCSRVGRYARLPLGAPFIKTAARQLAPSGYASRPDGVGLGHMLKTVEDVYLVEESVGL